ncbi:hypothetical protein Pan181_49640 [Aeoliella mucimassa]|uniref:Uncharacterized protein n=2 Tax=Aeoliella mucimassa TaxID=2527972 RepID=A0A518AVH2_9BACT|nr:hypothetical protein Pan181_49640 [Aeoliella mucimassa]
MLKSNHARTVLLVALLVFSVTASSAMARGRGGASRPAGRAGSNLPSPSGNIADRSPSVGSHQFNGRTPTGTRNLPTPSTNGRVPTGNKAFGQGNFSGQQPQNAQQVQAFLNGQSLGEMQGNLSQLNGNLSQLNQNAQQLSSRSQQWSDAAQNWDPSNLQSAASNWQNGPEPFSPAWYAEHPNAWQATHPYANEAAAVATVASVAAWTAYAAYPASSSSTVVIEGDTVVYESSSDEPAPTGVPADQQEWMPLGTYEVAPQAGAAATRQMQLAVSRQSNVAGVYFDQLTGSTQNLTGQLDAQSQVVVWQAENNPSVQFSATLQDLTSDKGTVRVKQGNQEFHWAMNRSP